MGKGGYLGGSTVVGGFGWSSVDPAAVGQWQKEGKQEKRPGTPVVHTRRKGQKRPASFDTLRITYLGAVIDAALRAQLAPPFPRAAQEELEKAVQKAGGASEWARAQPEFKAMYEKKQRKLASKSPSTIPQGVVSPRKPAKPAAPSRRIIGDTGKQSVFPRDALCAERARLSAAIMDAESEISRCRKLIAGIDAKLEAMTKRR
ncbi:hypothetical protein EJC49_01090 [Aquibium carbonis]|uniref:Uncharacterized protein n=1 Tax=Aquibium carbonis TaxID=2495581 RepID=A0A429Z3Y4_9HYPH|nr:hypothetical protein [Aquibium carbonis]RST88324.1 hypothetical protein EJC49_01090 [Aquibium carbonis]